MMTRRTFLCGLTLGALPAPLAVEAQQQGRVYQIGELREGSALPSKPFTDAMRRLGWVEGQNFKIEGSNANGPEQLPALAAELVRLKVDLILTTGTPATRAAKEATKTIPIVFTLAADPVESGLVASFARPGGNLTGFAVGVYGQKLLEVLKEALPRLSHVAYPDAPGASRESLNAAARVLGVEIKGIAVQEPKDFDSFFAAAKRLGDGAVLVPKRRMVWPSSGTHRSRCGEEPSACNRLRPAIRRVGRVALLRTRVPASAPPTALASESHPPWCGRGSTADAPGITGLTRLDVDATV